LKVIGALSITTALLWGWYLYTGQIWEDFLITLRISHNAAVGNGLVFTLGERIHGFTSPINVLLPAAILSIRTSLTPETVLTIYNFVATILLLAASVPFYRRLIAEDTRLSLPSWIFLPLAIGLNVKICSFATNGQEAAFTLAFLGLAFVALWRDEPGTWKLMGLSWGGLMWTRPDSPVLIAALGIAAFAFTSQPRKQILFTLLKSATVCTAIYLPWFLWASWYYGSPIPHTILAKQMYTYDRNGSPGFGLLRFGYAFWDVLPRQFTPTYAECGGWPTWYFAVSRTLAAVTCFYWLVPIRDRIGRSASVVCLAWIAYQAYVGATARAFPWYFPAAGFAGAIVLLRISTHLAGIGKKAAVGSILAGTVMLCVFAFGYIESLTPTKLRQIYIENGIRRQIGLWLKENVLLGEKVYLEPIGYIGYFSKCELYDYPGLVSPRVVQTIREHHAGFDSCIEFLKPEWLALRATEAVEIEKSSDILKAYKLIAVFGPTPEFKKIQATDSTYALQADTVFCILRRRD
jgi:hypothetical protein